MQSCTQDKNKSSLSPARVHGTHRASHQDRAVQESGAERPLQAFTAGRARATNLSSGWGRVRRRHQLLLTRIRLRFRLLDGPSDERAIDVLCSNETLHGFPWRARFRPRSAAPIVQRGLPDPIGSGVAHRGPARHAQDHRKCFSAERARNRESLHQLELRLRPLARVELQ